MEEQLPEEFIAVYLAVCGWKSVCMVHLNDPETPGNGYYEPLQTGHFSYATKEEAIKDAKKWAEAEELPYVETRA